MISHSLQAYAREVDLPLADGDLTSRPLVAAAKDMDIGRYTGLNPSEDWSTTLANEIRSSVSYYLAQANAGSVETVVLSGRGATIPGLGSIFQEELEVQVEILHPLANLQESLHGNNLEIAQQDAVFASCIGLALRGLGA